MPESMRGTRLGALSYETDENIAPAERIGIRYVCPEDHQTVVPFSVEAEEIPYEWTCRCGRTAVRPDTEEPVSDKPVKHVRTHWDMLLERRTIPELEELLQERLALLRERTSLAKSA